MTQQIVSYQPEALAKYDSIDSLNAKIASVLKDYDVDLDVKFEAGKNFSKMVSEAQDRVKMAREGKGAKEARRDQFRLVQAIFINEGISFLIEGLMHKLGYQPRFGGMAKTGDVTVKFVTPTRQDTDVVGKLAVAQAKGKRLVDRNRATEQRASAAVEMLLAKGVTKDQLLAQGIIDVEASVVE